MKIQNIKNPNRNSFIYSRDGYLKVKDYYPRYNMVEVELNDLLTTDLKVNIPKKHFKEIVDRFGNCQLLTAIDYEKEEKTKLVIYENRQLIRGN